MLTGDTDAATWKHIRGHYYDAELACSIFLASYHGSLTFFDDPSDDKYYFTDHLKAMSPGMTVISVGEDNAHGHPDSNALKFYEKYSEGSSKGNKIKRTDEHGSLLLELKNDGGWSMTRDR
jgi:beta-lactamase superfamily II metal-dependent hydrolase